MKLILCKRSDGLLEPADNDTIEVLRSVGSSCVFTTEGLKNLDRSALQNAYLWGWAYRNLAADLHNSGRVITCDDGTEIPFTKDILHDWVFADRFRVSGVAMFRGKEKKLYESTAKMSKARFTEYVEQIKQFSIQYWGVHIPETKNYAGLF